MTMAANEGVSCTPLMKWFKGTRYTWSKIYQQMTHEILTLEMGSATSGVFFDPGQMKRVIIF